MYVELIGSGPKLRRLAGFVPFEFLYGDFGQNVFIFALSIGFPRKNRERLLQCTKKNFLVRGKSYKILLAICRRVTKWIVIITKNQCDIYNQLEHFTIHLVTLRQIAKRIL